uniref:UDENN domain-containing protein n=1 Tax=Plectus sambesii TaxID=2011161 RepID=A0A914W3S0_9BILA
MASTDESLILHVLVVGFHHKKGCQIEYCYPPLGAEGATVADVDIPEEWHNLPSLALPDGAHNVEKDTVFFLLPDRNEPNRSIYGVSCYRQMAAAELLTKSADVTRSTVQKSVCVLSRVPLFGLLKAKIELITQAYFNERDFAKVEVLADMYQNLRETVHVDIVESQALLDLSPRSLVWLFKHRVVLLFKLLLLERRVLFQIFPVHQLCHTILALLSLYPKMIEAGLPEAAAYTPKKSLVSESDAPDEETEQAGNVSFDAHHPCVPKDRLLTLSPVRKAVGPCLTSEFGSIGGDKSSLADRVSQIGVKLGGWWTTGQTTAAAAARERQKTGIEVANEAVDEAEHLKAAAELKSYSTLSTDSYGFPLSIFTKGSLCHPYLSLSYLDMLKLDCVRAYAFGATNALFRQRKDLLDAIVTIDEAGEGQIEILDADLRRQLTLTTADLRFGDYLVRHVASDTGDVFVDATSWEGGDEWVRLQFRSYLLSLMATTKANDRDAIGDFSETFVDAWKAKHNYRIWACGHYPDLQTAVAGHPFAGQLSVSDMKLRLEHSLGSSEQGRKVTAVVSQTGKYVSQTGRNVKSSLTAWFSDLTGQGGNASAALDVADVASPDQLTEEKNSDELTKNAP